MRQLLVLFAFFTLVLVSVFWISRSVSLFDRLIGNGQSALVFLEFTALSLPTLIRTVMPMAVFGAAVYATNRLNRESELIIMLATGCSPWRLARPVLMFGILAGLMMALVTLYLRPASIQQLDRREAEVSRDIAAQLLQEGSFLQPAPRVTVYIGGIDEDGTLRDVYLSDRRVPEQPVTYTGAEAYLLRTENGASLVMVDGMAQQLDRDHNTLSTTIFQDFTYDISEMVQRTTGDKRNIRAVSTRDLMFDRDRLEGELAFPVGKVVEELNQRFSWPAICIAVAMIGFSVLMLGGFSRFGLWPQVLLAFGALIVLEGLRGFASPVVEARPSLWWILYLPSLGGVIFAAICLQFAGRPFQILFQRRRAANAIG